MKKFKYISTESGEADSTAFLVNEDNLLGIFSSIDEYNVLTVYLKDISGNEIEIIGLPLRQEISAEEHRVAIDDLIGWTANYLNHKILWQDYMNAIEGILKKYRSDT